MGGRHRGFGLTIESDYPLPGAAPAGSGAAQLSIVAGPVGAGEGVAYGPYTKAADGLIFAMPGVGRFHADSSGSRLTVHAEGPDVAGMLLATAIPMALWLRGEKLLHAAALVLPRRDSAVAILGASGAGKSTLLRQAEGARIITDDVLAVHADGRCCGLPGGTWVRGQGDARSFLEVPPACQLEEGRLGLLLVLEPGAGSLRRLSPAEALAALLSHLHRPRIPRILGRMPSVLPGLAALARAVPVYSVKQDTRATDNLWHSPELQQALQQLAPGVSGESK